MKKVIILSGTPGTGKTTIANILCESLPATLIDINEEVIHNHFYTEDLERETKIADVEKLKAHLVQKIKHIQSEFVLVEGHYADILPNSLVYIAIILRTHPEILRKRLEQKGYSEKKISENIQAEILGDCSFHALNNYGAVKVHELDNSKMSIKDTVEFLISLIRNNKPLPQINRIDWLELLERDGKLSKYFD